MKTCLAVLGLCLGLSAQVPKTVAGSISAFRPETAEIEVKSDGGAAQTFKTTAGTTIVKKIAPGQTDLTKAETISITDIAVGDRVLVTTGVDQTDARRIIVISANDLTKRDANDKADWQKRGVSGVVTAIAGNDISVELKSMGGAATKFVVTANPKTTYTRYSKASVKFADATKSSLSELAVGDQIRARGQKSADGAKVEAEDIVFGTFLSRAGTITAVNGAAGEVTIKDLANNKPVVVKFLADSQVKRIPESPAMAGGRGGPPPGAMPMPGRGPAGAGPRGPDINQMLEGLPRLKVEDLKAGEVIIVSAIPGAKADQITAVIFLANAEALVPKQPGGPSPSLAGLASGMGSVGP